MMPHSRIERPLVVQHCTDPPDCVQPAGVVGGGDPLGRAVAARAMERATMMDVNCIFGGLFGRR